jgi:hypothetical protein
LEFLVVSSIIVASFTTIMIRALVLFAALLSARAFTVTTTVGHSRPVRKASSSALGFALADIDAIDVVVAAIAVAVMAVGTGKMREVDKDSRERALATPSPAATPPASGPAKSLEVAPVADPLPDLSIPYDAAARMAFEASGSKGDYAAFKAKYEADAVKDVIAKRKK